MSEIFSKESIYRAYLSIKSRKKTNQNKAISIGVDGVSSDIFERNFEDNVNEIYRKLLVNNGSINYSFAPFLRIEKLKKYGGVRYLHIPRLRDQIVLRLIHDEIQRLASARQIDLKVPSPYSFVKRFDFEMNSDPSRVILKTDIAQFYDQIPREKAIELCDFLGMNPVVFNLLKKWGEELKVRSMNFFIDSDKITCIGLPQGLSISSILAELYIRQIDDKFDSNGQYFRYIDDILIICKDKKEAVQKVEELTEMVEKIGLKLSGHKTEILNFHDGFEWLGLHHFPNRKHINPEKLLNAVKPIIFFKKECILKIKQTSDEQEKIKAIRFFIKKIERLLIGSNKNRIKWYSFIHDEGQWKKMDQFIHGKIYHCIRKSKLDENLFLPLPSIHAIICSFKKMKESQKIPNKGDAPIV